jgi:hypothetical protein
MIKFFRSRLWFWIPLTIAILLLMSFPFLFITAFSPEQNRHPFWLSILQVLFLFGDRLVLWPFLLLSSLMILHFFARRQVAPLSTCKGPLPESATVKLADSSSSLEWINLAPVLGFMLIMDYGLVPKGIMLLALPFGDIFIAVLSCIVLLYRSRYSTSMRAKVLRYIFGITGLYLAWQIGLISHRELNNPPTSLRLILWSITLHIGTLLGMALHYVHWQNSKRTPTV